MSEDLSDYQLSKRDVLAFAEVIPDGGATIIALTGDIGRWMKEGIAHVRGPAIARRCRVVLVRAHGSEQRIAGLSGDIILPWLWRKLCCERLQQMVAAAPGINVVWPR